MKRTTLAVLATLGLAVACNESRHAPTAPDVTASPPRLSASVVSATPSGATVNTVKEDYAPGEMVTIKGAGWAPAEEVQLHLTEDPVVDGPHEWTVIADSVGSFVDTSFTPGTQHLGVAFTLVAAGSTSGSAEALFFDGNVTTATIATDQPTITSGSAITASGTVTIAGNGNTNATVRWYDAANTEVRKTTFSYPNGSTSGTFSDTFGPPGPSNSTSSPQTWTVKVCSTTGNACGEVVSKQFTVTTATRTVTVTISNTDQTYNGTPRPITVTTSPTASTKVTYDGSTTAPTNAGTYHVVAEVDQSGFTGKAEADLTIAPKAVTPAVAASNKVYDGNTTAAITGCTLSGVVGSDHVTCTAAAGAFDTKNVGTDKAVTATSITLGGSSASNYALSAATATTKANITARTLHVSATGVDKTYDGTAAASVTLSDDRVAGDELTLKYGDAHFADKNVGTKAVFVSDIAISGGADAGNYLLGNTATTAQATIHQRPAAVTPNPASKTYGDPDPAEFTGTLSNFIAADNIAASYTRTPGESAGPYAISVTLAPAGALANYHITYNTATFTILQRPITLTAQPQSKYFGDPDPALTYQITAGSLAFSDQLSGTLARDPGETVGTYAIRQGSVAAGPNYAITFIQATLTIRAWSPKGFYQPVDMSPQAPASVIWNTVKGGSTVPLKFEVFKIDGDPTSELRDVAIVKPIFSKQIACSGGGDSDVEVAATGGTVLRFDGSGDQFIYNWQTPKGPAGSCYQVTVTFADGSHRDAFFKLK